MPARGGLSVVIPSYNHERFVGEAVDSVRDQTLAPEELLVVDDGSIDGTLDVLVDHAFPAMRCLPQENRGAHAALNRAIELTCGDYVAIVNSDDVLEPERLEHAWAAARATGAVLVLGAVRWIDDEGRDLPPEHEGVRWYRAVREAVARARSIAAAVRKDNLAVTTSNFFLHRALWRKLGGFRPYRYVHDYDFLLRAVAVCAERVVFREELCDVRYRVHDANTISDDVERALAERAEMLRAHRSPWRSFHAALTRPIRSRDLARAVARTALPAPVAAQPRPSRGDALRVGLVTRSLELGGLEEIVALLARSLPAVGIEVAVLCTQRGGAVADRLRSAGVAVEVGNGEPEAWLRWQRETAPDVISTHYVGAEAMEALAAAAPVVDTLQNTYAWLSDPEWGEELAKHKVVAATVAVSRLVARFHAARIEAAAARDRERDAGMVGGPSDGGGLQARRAYLIPNAVHPARAACLPRVLARRLLGITPEDPLFVHVGRVTAQKNLTMLVGAFMDAAERSSGARLILAGPADDQAALERLRSLAPGAFRAGVVRHLREIDPVGALLSAADAFVSSSFYEGWSVAASEALWVGIPVVLTDCGGARELVGDNGQRGHVVPNPLGDPLAATPELLARPPDATMAATRRALVRALERVVEERPVWHARSAEIRAHARAALAPERMAAAYADVFRAVSGKDGG